MDPKYCENIIAGVRYRCTFEWYITSKDIWRLDFLKYYKMWEDYYEQVGRSKKQLYFELGSVEKFCEKRWGIEIVDSRNAMEFLSRIRKFQVPVEELRELFNSANCNPRELYPSFYVDFDKKFFCSYFAEPENFEDYVPEGWRGVYSKFEDLIPNKQKYWEVK